MTTGGCGEPAVERAGWGMFAGGSCDRQRRERRDSGRSEVCRTGLAPSLDAPIVPISSGQARGTWSSRGRGETYPPRPDLPRRVPPGAPRVRRRAAAAAAAAADATTSPASLPPRRVRHDCCYDRTQVPGGPLEPPPPRMAAARPRGGEAIRPVTRGPDRPMRSSIITLPKLNGNG
jgi:hypothetical protein